MQDDLALALRLADAADAVTLPRFRAADLRVTTKPDRSPVTDADTAAEEALRALITAERPADAVLGEEGGGEVTDVGRLWVLDPIDGTKNFSRGMPAWATLIALTVDGAATVGVVSAPALGRRWWGAVGEGAWTSDAPGGAPRRISVSGVVSLGDAYLSTTDLREFRGRRDRWLALCDAVWETRAFGDFCSTSSWPRGCWTWRSIRWRTRGTWPRSRPSSRRRGEGSPTSPASTPGRAATRSPRTARCTTRPAP